MTERRFYRQREQTVINVRIDCDDMECFAREDIDVVSRHWRAKNPISSYLPEGWKVIQADCDEAIALCPKHATTTERTIIS